MRSKNPLIWIFILWGAEHIMIIPISRPSMGKEEIDAVTEVLKSGNLVQGEKVRQFEADFRKYIGTGHGVAVSSGTAALQIGLQALGLQKDDEVITTPFTFAATANAIIHCGAKPVFADIDPGTFNIDPVKIKERLTERTKAIVCVHLYGQPCEMDSIMRICKYSGAMLTEDAAQAVGAEYRGKKVGSFGHFSAFSFYATKNITTGEGGMILTDSEELAGKASIIRNQGQSRPYRHDIVSYNFRMTDMQAAIGIEQLKKVELLNQRRMENAQFLTESLSGLPGLEVPFVQKGVKHVFHQYTVRVPKGRDRLLEHLNKQGIGAKVYYPEPVYLQPPYEKMGFEKGLCPVSEETAKSVLSLPVHPLVSEADLDRIVKVVKECLHSL
jgi:perosamine synthetase